jgi:hypothetical protein
MSEQPVRSLHLPPVPSDTPQPSFTHEADPSVTPFRGLRSFEERDAAVFFGRDGDRRAVLANLLSARLTVVYGESGVGKTSLLRAGVLHELEEMSVVERSLSFRVLRFADWQPNALTALKTAVARCLGVATLDSA